MAKAKPKKLKKRIFTSYLTTTVSITLVLFLVGLLALIFLNAGRLTEYVREKIGFTLVLNEDLKEQEVSRLEKQLQALPFVKETKYIDKEAAARLFTEELGEDFSGFLGFNPLSASIEVKLFAPYTETDSLKIIEGRVRQYPQVKEVYYQRSLVSVINENVTKISLFLVIFCALMLFIFIALINNTIRISVYSQRFIINSMLLVGATRSFVRKPFVRKSIACGLYGAFFSGALLAVIMFSYKKELTGIFNEEDLLVLGIVIAIVFVTAILLTWISSTISVNRFLKMKFDELFY
ncbi:MAG: permease-like cell division protein FtsX [Prolixibacteraceae bacterium]|nr:permease-like cell division protein FtsX [Prolixibacteraceae bacterium]